jgi:hypothetical protein
MQLLGNSDILTFVRISLLNWIGHGNEVNSKTKIGQAFNNNPQGSRLRGRPNNRWWNRVQKDRNKCK